MKFKSMCGNGMRSQTEIENGQMIAFGQSATRNL